MAAKVLQRGRGVDVVGHVDADCFFVSCEIVRRPLLRGRCVAVGGTGGRGVVASASYEARARGVHSAMSTKMAKAACPELIVLQPDFEWYHALSLELIAALAERSDVIEPVSIDEAYFGLEGLHWGEVEEFAIGLRTFISTRVGVEVSVGMGPSRAVAKMASGAAKPAGVVVVRPEGVEAWMRPRKVSSVSGIGSVAAKALAEAGIVSIGDALDFSGRAVEVLGGSRAGQLGAVASGRDSNIVGEITQRQSIGSEITLEHDANNREDFGRALAHVAKEAYSRLRLSSMGAKGMSVKIRTSGFVEFSISSNWGRPRNDPAILDAVRAVASRCWDKAGASVRLVGVSFSGLSEEVQLTLGGDAGGVGRQCDVGQRVRHPVYGEGSAVWRSGDSVIVRFSAGVRIISNADTYLRVV